MNIYTLEDLYVMFSQAKTHEEKVSLLEHWSSLHCDYRINWDRLLYVWANPGKTLSIGEQKRGYS